jgi:hypothetical protein
VKSSTDRSCVHPRIVRVLLSEAFCSGLHIVIGAKVSLLARRLLLPPSCLLEMVISARLSMVTTSIEVSSCMAYKV